MNFRDELARIIASDPRYSIEAYAFVLEALNHAKHQKLKAKGRERDKERSTEPDHEGRASSSSSKKSRVTGHVTGRALCEAVRSTSDIGDIVYNLIAAGDLEKTRNDSRSDFDNVFDFDTALKPKAPKPADGVA
jgi:uncharacterized repeat protein (TIGR04138 family)